MKKISLKPLLLTLTLALGCTFIACSSAPSTVVNPSEYVYVEPAYSDSLQGYLVDTVIVFNKIVERDTIYQAKYYPEYKTLTVKGKTDTIRITVQDTIKQTITKIEETSWLEKMGYMFLGLIVAAGILFVVKKFI